MNSRIVIILAILLNGFFEADAKLNVFPRDTEVKIDDSTFMNCSTSLQADLVQWRHGKNYVYTGIAILEPYNERFSVEINASTGACNLVIRSVQPSDAGKYECSEDEGFGEGRSVQLIVLDNDPVCKSNIHSGGVIGPNSCDLKPDEIQLSCSTSYHGNTLPILQWKASGDNQFITEGLFSVTSSNNEVNNTLTISATINLNNASFICETTRTSGSQYSCSHTVIKIMYVVSSEVTVNMTMNDEVNCFANTSQSCDYKWKWFSGDDSTTESDNQVLKPKKVGWHRCEATCSIGDQLCTVQSMYAEVYSTATTSEQNLLTLLILLLIPTVVVAVIAAIKYYRRKKEKKTSLTNDEIKHRILNVYAKFVSHVEPDRLCDWLVQEHVITIDQKQRIRHENPIASDRCRALLDHLFSIQHPRAFLVVRRALSKENHYLLEGIDNQESVDGIPVQPDEQPVLLGKHTIQQLEKDSENQKRAWEEEKDRLLKMQQDHDSQKRAWEEEKDRLLKMVKEHEDQRRAWEEEKGPLLKIQNEYDDQKRAGEAEKDRLRKMHEEHEDQKRAWEEENDRLLKMQEELEANLHLGSMTNDEIKHRILNNYTKFVSDVEPDRLSDWLVQGGVVSIEQWQRIRHENHTRLNRCRALLYHLFSIQHPRAFLIVREALYEVNHYLLEYIDNQ